MLGWIRTEINKKKQEHKIFYKFPPQSQHQKAECDAGTILDKLPFVQPVKACAAVVLKTTEPVQRLGNPFLLLKRI